MNFRMSRFLKSRFLDLSPVHNRNHKGRDRRKYHADLRDDLDPLAKLVSGTCNPRKRNLGCIDGAFEFVQTPFNAVAPLIQNATFCVLFFVEFSHPFHRVFLHLLCLAEIVTTPFRFLFSEGLFFFVHKQIHAGDLPAGY